MHRGDEPIIAGSNRGENVVAHLWTHEKRCDITRASSNDNLYAIYKRNNIRYGDVTAVALRFDYCRSRIKVGKLYFAT